jgi:hypothetical protein
MTIKNEECVICLDEISGEQELYFFNNCVHIIHQSCFITCIQIKPFINCPSCRKPILNKKEEDIIFSHISIIIPDNSINNPIVNNHIVNNPVVNNPVVNNPVVNNPVVNNPVVNNPVVNNHVVNNPVVNNHVVNNEEINERFLCNQNDCDENNCIKTQRFCISLFLVIAIVIFLTIRV